MKTVIMDHVMDTRFELQYRVVAEFKYSFFPVRGNFRLCQLCDGSCRRGLQVLKAMWCSCSSSPCLLQQWKEKLS